jgi:hypothetical protein
MYRNTIWKQSLKPVEIPSLEPLPPPALPTPTVSNPNGHPSPNLGETPPPSIDEHPDVSESRRFLGGGRANGKSNKVNIPAGIAEKLVKGGRRVVKKASLREIFSGSCRKDVALASKTDGTEDLTELDIDEVKKD